MYLGIHHFKRHQEPSARYRAVLQRRRRAPPGLAGPRPHRSGWTRTSVERAERREMITGGVFTRINPCFTSRASGFGFRVSGLFRVSGFQLSRFSFRVSRLVLWISGFVFQGFSFRASACGFRVSVCGFRVSSFRFQVSGLGFNVSDFRLWISGFGSQGSRLRVSGFGFRVVDFGFRVVDFGILGCGHIVLQGYLSHMKQPPHSNLQ
jgi:hypothetical protein